MRDDAKRVAHAIPRALQWLKRRIPRDELPCLVAEDPTFSDGVPDSTYFPAAQALWSLAFVSGASTLVARLKRFVRSGVEPSGAWRFWTRKTVRPIDADTDMTACAAAALRAVGEDAPAASAQVLLDARETHGRFATWVRPASAPNDVCAVVNANVIWYLRELPETTDAIEWIIDLVTGSAPPLPLGYYDTPLFLHHAISRAAFDGAPRLRAAKDAALTHLSTLRASSGGYGTALDAALALCTLTNYGERDPDAVRWLFDHQDADGSWPAAAFWNGPEQPAPRSLWWGSSELTTSVALEALARSVPPATTPRRRARARPRGPHDAR